MLRRFGHSHRRPTGALEGDLSAATVARGLSRACLHCNSIHGPWVPLMPTRPGGFVHFADICVLDDALRLPRAPPSYARFPAAQAFPAAPLRTRALKMRLRRLWMLATGLGAPSARCLRSRPDALCLWHLNQAATRLSPHPTGLFSPLLRPFSRAGALSTRQHVHRRAAPADAVPGPL